MKRRKLDGVLLLDKAETWSSNGALQKVRWLLAAEKGGHTGTLDPFATGLLPICLGEATKFSGHLLESDKTYLASLKLGIRTASGDTEGDILATAPVTVSRAHIEAALPSFIGDILQIPPMYSALKQNGRPLYELARQGITVERAARPITVHRIDLVSFADVELVLRVHCGKGFYVRTLADDLGQMLGCGAHLTALRRERVGPFSLDGSVSIAQLETEDMPQREARLLPPDSLLTGMARIDLDSESAWQMRHGQPVWRSRLVVGEAFCVYDDRGMLLGLAEVNHDGLLAPKRLLQNT